MQKWLSVPAVIITCEGTINEGNSLADIRCRRFSDILRTKEDHYPYSDRYISEVHDSSTKTGRTERRAHGRMVSRERDQGKRFVQQADSELQRETDAATA